MNLEDQQKTFEVITDNLKQILFKKGNDYSNSDRLSSFKLSGAICNNSAELNCLNLIATKVSRLGNLLSSKQTPNNESIEDSILDGMNYFFLLYCLLQEKKTIDVFKKEIDRFNNDIQDNSTSTTGTFSFI